MPPATNVCSLDNRYDSLQLHLHIQGAGILPLNHVVSMKFWIFCSCLLFEISFWQCVPYFPTVGCFKPAFHKLHKYVLKLFILLTTIKYSYMIPIKKERFIKGFACQQWSKNPKLVLNFCNLVLSAARLSS